MPGHVRGWLILKDGNSVIRLCQGMFEGNILTFNPGWNQDQETLEGFTDVRAIQRQLQEPGVERVQTCDPSSSRPASITLRDPDGNAILIDQHV